jgi:hypothetical protein
MMNRFLIFTILTFCGAAIRCFIDVKFGAVTTQHSLATFSINIAGAFIAGIFMSIGESGYWSREMTITLIGGFLVWVGYKLVTALLPFTKNSFVDAGSGAKVRELVTLFLSIFSQNGSSDIWLWGAVILIVIGLSLWKWKTLSPFHLLIVQATVVSLAGLLIHRVPSEAYMPIVAPLVALTVGYSTQLFSKKIVWAVSAVLAVSLFFSLRVLLSTHFFLLQPGESDWGARRFGPSIETQEQIVSKLYEISGNRCITLESLERDVTYPTLYNHLEYLIALDPRSGGASCSRIRIDRAPEARRRWIDQGDVVDLGAYWVRRLDEQRIYANAN